MFECLNIPDFSSVIYEAFVVCSRMREIFHQAQVLENIPSMSSTGPRACKMLIHQILNRNFRLSSEWPLRQPEVLAVPQPNGLPGDPARYTGKKKEETVGIVCRHIQSPIRDHRHEESAAESERCSDIQSHHPSCRYFAAPLLTTTFC